MTEEYSAKHVLYQAFKEYWHKEREFASDVELLQKLIRYSEYFVNLYYKKPDGKYLEVLSDFQSMESMMPALSFWSCQSGIISIRLFRRSNTLKLSM